MLVTRREVCVLQTEIHSLEDYIEKSESEEVLTASSDSSVSAAVTALLETPSKRGESNPPPPPLFPRDPDVSRGISDDSDGILLFL